LAETTAAPPAAQDPQHRFTVGALLALAVGGTLVAAASLADLRPGAANASFGLGQSVEFVLGLAIVMLGLDLRRGEGAAWRASLGALATTDGAKLVAVGAQLALIAFIAGWYQIESPAFATSVVPFMALTFVIHHLVPKARRLTLFVAISLVSYVLVLGAANAAWITVIVLAFLGICHLPVSLNARLALLLAAAFALAFLRVSPAMTPFSGAIWPILGSILMFRLIMYWYDLKHARKPIPATWSLAYFFMVPNVAFPLFPVVDFSTMQRTHYDQEPFRIYQRGLEWVMRGLVHLLLYRLVYQYLMIAPEEVADGTKLVRYMLATFLMYLRVSGTFHVIVGALHLYGFRLPETHRLFYLSTSISDFWRRINIYWKDFMQKVVFLPVYFPLRKRGETLALVVGTIVVFFITWATHAYQWFWLRGEGLWSATDALFWAILGVLLIGNSLWEAKRGRKRVLPGAKRSLRDALINGASAAGVFALICTLWTMWGSPTFGDWIDLMRVPSFTLRDGLAVAAVLGTVFAVAVIADLTGRSGGDQETSAKAPAPAFAPHAMKTIAALGVLALTASPYATRPFGTRAQEIAREMRFPELNKRDAKALQRGYYEGLQGVTDQNPELRELMADRPTDGQDIWQSGVLVERPDFLGREMQPMWGTYQGGQSFRTNEFGMRDRAYARVKPSKTFRIALLGQSYVAGDGVSDGETFEQLVEDSLNALQRPGAPKAEFLNFGVGSFSAAQQLLLLDDRVLSFSPDVVIRVAHPGDAERLSIHTVTQVRRGVQPPWPAFAAMLAGAQVTSDLRETEALSRMVAIQDSLLGLVEAEFVRKVRAAGAIPVWIYLDLPERQPDAAHVAAMATRARNAGFHVLDWSDVYDGRDMATLRSSKWDFHPNKAGHRLIGDRFHRDLVADTALGLPRAFLEPPR
jgi:D-alanyl-lipoteichoic acid acyltransferase DltB (MBOAT superfamily)